MTEPTDLKERDPWPYSKNLFTQKLDDAIMKTESNDLMYFLPPHTEGYGGIYFRTPGLSAFIQDCKSKGFNVIGIRLDPEGNNCELIYLFQRPKHGETKNIDEYAPIPSWLIERLENAIYGFKSTGVIGYRDGYVAAISWVLSLKSTKAIECHNKIGAPMTIPSIEERKKRSGRDNCVFFDGDYCSCILYNISGCESNCDANFTQKEMQELIDNHNSVCKDIDLRISEIEEQLLEGEIGRLLAVNIVAELRWVKSLMVKR